MSEYRLTDDAEADLLDVFLYGFERFGVLQASAYKDGLARCFQLIAENPGIGRPARDVGLGVRRHEHARHVIFYEEASDGVLILAVIHERSIRTLRR